MYWVTVEGRVMPKLVGGHDALDLCNTYAGWGGPPRPNGEWLPDADAMIVWCLHAGLLDAGVAGGLRDTARARPVKARRTLERVRQLRGDLYATLVGVDDAAFDRVAEVAQRSAHAARLVRRPDGGAQWLLSPDLGLDLPLLRLAERAAAMLASEERAIVRVCPGEGCAWLFVDRRGTRRWCSMQTCGNKAKTKAFAYRRRA